MLKKFLSEVAEGLTPSTWWKHEELGTNTEASIELKGLFDGEACFQTPKPIKLLNRICDLGTEEDSLVLDFFAGSGTTGAACLELERRFILVDSNPQAIEVMKKRFETQTSIEWVDTINTQEPK